MVTGASTADLAIVLVDARKGLVHPEPPPRRDRRRCCGSRGSSSPSTRWTSSTGTSDVFRRICGDFRGWSSRLDVEELACIPISALQGRQRRRALGATSTGTAGRRCSATSRTAPVAAGRDRGPLRLPVQCVVRARRARAPRLRRPDRARHRARRRRGRRAPVGRPTRVAGDRRLVGPVRGGVPAAVGRGAAGGRARRLARRPDRARRRGSPRRAREMEATRLLDGRGRRAARAAATCSSTRRATVRAVVETVHHTSRSRRSTSAPARTRSRCNEIGRVTLRASGPLRSTPTRDNRTTGSFILIDEATNETVGAGMIDAGR